MNRNKVVVIGNSRSGKTSMLNRFLTGTFDSTHTVTIGIDWFTKTLTAKRSADAEPENVVLYLWDTGGQERFKSLTPSYTKDARVVLLVYDVTDMESFEQTYYWRDMAIRGNPSIQLYLVGNKIDLAAKRLISPVEGERHAADMECRAYFEISSKTGQNLDSMFATIAEHIARDSASTSETTISTPVSTLQISSAFANNNASSCWC